MPPTGVEPTRIVVAAAASGAITDTVALPLLAT
jgi:hypothetical protein